MDLANYADSALFGFQGRVRAGLAAHEVRDLDTAVLGYALRNQKFFENIMDIRAIKKSEQRPVYGYQFNRITTANGTGMTTFPSGTLGSSVQIPLTFVTFTQNFATYNVTGLDNVMQFAQIFDNQAKQATRQIRIGIRQWLTQNLYNNRSGVLPSVNTNIKNANFNATNYCYEISSSPNPFSQMASVMQQAGYGNMTYDALLDPVLYSNQYLYQNAQGNMNAQNLNFQFGKMPTAPGSGYFDNIWQDLNLGTTVPIESSYTNGTALVMPKNAFAFVPWMPANYYAPGFSKNFDEYVGGYGTIFDDMYDGLEYQIFGWNNQSDTSGSYGYAQSQTQNWQLGFTAAFVPAYFSNTGESAIYQFAPLGA